MRIEVISLFRRTLRRVIPAYASFPLLLTGLMNLFAYQGAKLVQLIFLSQEMLDMTTALDRRFPFAPVWVLAYVGTFVFWFYQYTTVARESPEKACRLAAADAVAKLICLFFFVFVPTTNVRPTVEGSGFVPWLMRLIYWFDTPTNLFPSIHCFVAWLGTRFMYECRLPKHRALTNVLCTVGSLLVFLSTLFTKQHVLWDVVSGVAVAELGYWLSRLKSLTALVAKLNERFMKTRLAKIL